MNPNDNTYQQPPQNLGIASTRPATPNHFFINQELKFGRETFSVTDGQNLVCVAKRKIMAVKEHMDIYRDEAATQLVFTIQRERVMTMSAAARVTSSPRPLF